MINKKGVIKVQLQEKQKKTKSNKAITLIALVITIIILLILGGIAIATLTGENGLFARAKQAKENYSVSSAKEKLQLAISDLMVEQTSKGENLTKEDLPKINNNEIDVKSTETFPVEVICENYIFSVDENFTVTYVREASGTVVTFTTEPESYTNKDEVKILVKISNSKGIKSIQKPGETDRILAQGQKEVGIDYKVTKNGHYIFTIVDEEGKETVKDIYIDLIDKVEPKDFVPTAKNITLEGFTICIDVEDGDKTETSTKSGIEKYEYYIKDSSESKYNKYETEESSYTITGLNKDTKYSVYVIAYDKAKNYKKSTTIYVTTLKIPILPIAELKFNKTNSVETKLEYPVLTLDGMTNCYLKPNAGENVTLQITSQETELTKYYYSIDGGNTWNKYDKIVNIVAEENTDIKVKSKYSDTVESISYSVRVYSYNKEEDTLSGTNALPKECYDRDFDTNSELDSEVASRFDIDPHCWGKYINIYYISKNVSYHPELCGFLGFGNIEKFGGDSSYLDGYKAKLDRGGKDVFTRANCSSKIPDGYVSGFFYSGYWTYGKPITYEIWCSNDNLAGNVYTNQNKPF